MTLPFRTLWNVGLVSWLFLASATVIAQEGDISVQDLVGDYYKNIEHSKVLCTFKNLHGVETDCLLNNFPQEQFCQDLAASYAENGELCDAITHGDAPIFAAPTDRRYQEHYAYVTKIAQDVQDRLTKILAAKATPQNAAAIDFLKAHIFKIKDGDLKIATQRDPYNAYSDFTEREIALSIEFVEQIPAVTLTMILAHELGHNISAPYYLGYDAPSLLPAEEVTEGAAGASDPQKAAWQKENERLIKLALAQKNTLENYPFYPELQQYQKLGITGLALIDPAKKDKVYALAKRLAQQLLAEGYVLVTSEIGGEVVPRPNLAEWLPSLILANSFEEHYDLIREDDEASKEDLVCRIDEVLADHFARLVLESYLQEIKDPAARRQFARQALLLFIFMPDVKQALAWSEKFPAILLPKLGQWQHDMQEDSASGKLKAKAWATVYDWSYTTDFHPSMEERLKIFLASPIIQMALRDTASEQ